MPSPITSSSTSIVNLSNKLSIDALLNPTKWGGVVGAGTSLSFSFPWASSSIANFAEWNARTYKWSAISESASSLHFGLNVEQQAAARGAMLSWAEVANIGAYEVAESSSNVGDVRFTWTTDQSQEAAWGWAYYPGGQPSGGDASLHASTGNCDSSTEQWVIGSWNYEALLHEIGHALGLKHPFDGSVVLPTSQNNAQYTVMSYDSAPHNLYYAFDGQYWTGYYIQPETPTVLGIAAIQYLYGANTTYHTGNDTYTFDPAKPFLKMLWDAAGNDTISSSNFTLPCHIDLTPDLGGLGFWIAGMDHDGVSLSRVSAGFINSAGFASVYGTNPTNAQIVRLYENVLHRAPEQGGYDYWMHQIVNGMQTTQGLTFINVKRPEFRTQKSIADSNDAMRTGKSEKQPTHLPRSSTTPGTSNFSLLESCSEVSSYGVTRNSAFIVRESVENQAQVIGVIQNGIEYSQYAA